MTIRAPLIYNRPLGQANQNPPGFIQGRVGGPSGGKQFAGNGQWKAYDYPNPTLRRDALYLAAYLRIEGGPRNATLLKGLDKQFAGPGQWRTYDYPNPRGPQRSIDLWTFINPTETQLIGKDKQFGTFGQWATYDYPNPRGSQRSVDLLSWVRSFNLGSLTVQAPLNQRDWPNPGVPRRVVDLLTWTQSPSQTSPFRQGDWPVPLGARFPSDLRTWLNAVELTLIGQDKFFGASGQGPANLDWPVPKGPSRSIDLNTWIQNLSQGTLAPVVVMPFSLLDWQNPNGYLFPSDLRTLALGFSMLDAIPQPPPPVAPEVTSGGGASGRRYRPPKWWEEGRRLKTEAQLRKEVEQVQKKIEAVRRQVDIAPDLYRMERLVEKLMDLQQRLLFLLAEIDDLNKAFEEDEVMKIYTIYRSLH